jgi:hypothetical protein
VSAFGSFLEPMPVFKPENDFEWRKAREQAGGPVSAWGCSGLRWGTVRGVVCVWRSAMQSNKSKPFRRLGKAQGCAAGTFSVRLKNKVGHGQIRGEQLE